jgi:hypothetical protein
MVSGGRPFTDLAPESAELTIGFDIVSSGTAPF